MQSPGNTRKAQRYPYLTRVRVRLDSARQILELLTQNVSAGGLFLRMPDPPQHGTAMNISFVLPDNRNVKLRAEVMHVSNGDPA